jgi:mRNA interferase MazF
MQRGEILWADLGEPSGSAPGYRRPVLIIQADWYNLSRLKTVIVVALSSHLVLADMPGNILLKAKDTGLPKDSVANVTQLVTLDKEDLLERVGEIEGMLMVMIENGIRQVLDLT